MIKPSHRDVRALFRNSLTNQEWHYLWTSIATKALETINETYPLAIRSLAEIEKVPSVDVQDPREEWRDKVLGVPFFRWMGGMLVDTRDSQTKPDRVILLAGLRLAAQFIDDCRKVGAPKGHHVLLVADPSMQYVQMRPGALTGPDEGKLKVVMVLHMAFPDAPKKNRAEPLELRL